MSRDFHSDQSNSSDSEREDDIALLPSLTQRLANIRLYSSDDKGNFQTNTREIPLKSSVENDRCDERKKGIDEGVSGYRSDQEYRSFSNSKDKSNKEHKLPVYDKRQQDDRIKETFNEEEQKLSVYDKRKSEDKATEIRCVEHTVNNQETSLNEQKEHLYINGACRKESDVCHPNSDFISVNKENLTSSTPCLTKKKGGTKSTRKSFIEDLLFSGDDDSLLGALDELEKPMDEGCIKNTPSHLEFTQNIDGDSLLDVPDILTQPKEGECVKNTPSNFPLSENVDDDSLLGGPGMLTQPMEEGCVKNTPSHFHLTQNVDDDSLLDILAELQEHSGEECRHETPSPPCCINLSTPNIVEDEQLVLKEVSNDFSHLGDSILDEDDKDIFQGTPSLGNHWKHASCQGDDKENWNDASSTVADFEKALRRKLNLTTTVEHNTKNEDSESDTKPSIAHVYDTASPLVETPTVFNTPAASFSPMCLADRLKARFRHARQ